MTAHPIVAVTALLVFTSGCSERLNTMDDAAWVIRTDFSSGEGWTTVRDLIAAPWDVAGMKVYGDLEYVDDRRHQGKPTLDLVRTLPDSYPGMFLFIVDRESIESPEHPVLVVGFYPSDGESFDR